MNHEQIEILLVEDNPDDVELTLMALRKRKIANVIHVARDGAQALDFLFCRGEYAERSFEQPPRLIMLDLKLPKVDGLEVLRELKNDPRTKSIPVAVMTSSKEQADVIRGYHLGVNSYVQKPIDFDTFSNIVHELGYYWLVVNQAPPSEAFKNPMDGSK